jgi:hypothetical protein
MSEINQNEIRDIYVDLLSRCGGNKDNAYHVACLEIAELRKRVQDLTPRWITMPGELPKPHTPVRGVTRDGFVGWYVYDDQDADGIKRGWYECGTMIMADVIAWLKTPDDPLFEKDEK